MFIPARPVPSAPLLEHLRLRHGLEWTGSPVDLGGSSSLNLLIRDTRRDVVVRVHRAWLEPARLSSIQGVRSALREAGLPVAETVPAVDGSLWTRLGEHLVEVENYVEGEEMNSWPRLLTGMPMLGRVHSALADIPAVPAARTSPTANQIEASEVLPSAQRAASIIRSWAQSAAETAAADRTMTLAQELKTARRQVEGRLPRQLIHGDFWHNNVLFGGDRVVLILDLDFMAERERIDDIALVLYYANSGSSLPCAASPGDRQHRLRQLLDAYDGGLSVRLTAEERAAIPLAMARIVLSYTRHMLQRPHEFEQRGVLASWSVDLDWSLDVLRDLRRWQEAFA